VNVSDLEPAAIAKWDPELTERLMGLIRPVIKGWHRAEVRGLEDFPTGGALVVANHSGGLCWHHLRPQLHSVRRLYIRG